MRVTYATPLFAEVRTSMSLQDDLTSAQRSVDDLLRSLTRLESRLGDGLDMRRVRTDAAHLRESLALLRERAQRPGPVTQSPGPEMVPVPDAPYDPALWAGAEDEGLGSPHGHAP